MINLNSGFTKDAHIYSAKHNVCSKSFSSVGQVRKVLDTHANALKHHQRLRNHNSTLKTAFAAGQTENRPSSSSKQTEKKAEIMWVLEVIIPKYSFCSCENKFELFSSMFPDSQVTKTFA